MPVFNCDIKQGFNFRKDASATIGYVTSLTVGDKVLDADLDMLADPLNATTVSGVAVLGNLDWNGEPSGPITLRGQLSAANQQRLSALRLSAATMLTVSVEFVVYDYDYQTERRFKACHTGGAPLRGTVARRDDRISLDVSDEAAPEPYSPHTYAFGLTIAPSGPAQSVVVADSEKTGAAQPWGGRE